MALPIDPYTGQTYAAEQQLALGDPLTQGLRSQAAWGDPAAAQRLSASAAYLQPLMGTPTLNPAYGGPGANILPQRLPQGQDPTQMITSLYQSTLGRAPDPGGLQTWLNAFNSGMPTDQIAAALANSPEGQARSAATPPGNPLASLLPPPPGASGGGGGPTGPMPLSQLTGAGGSGGASPDFSSIFKQLAPQNTNTFGAFGDILGKLFGSGSSPSATMNPTSVPPPQQGQQQTQQVPSFMSSGSGLPQQFLGQLSPGLQGYLGIGGAPLGGAPQGTTPIAGGRGM